MAMAVPPRDGGVVTLRYGVPRSRDEWTIPEETLPESQTHDVALDLLKALLLAWAARAGRNAQVARNLAVRWDRERPNVGADPDLCVIEPRTPEGDALGSLCLWKPGHPAPSLVVEVVSENRPRKDYETAPDRCAACGAGELWVFDPLLSGPASHGGPVRLQVWCRDETGAFERRYAGEGPAASPYLGAWLVAVEEGRKLRIARDARGEDLLPTPAEAAERDRQAEARAREAAERRVGELEAELARRKGG